MQQLFPHRDKRALARNALAPFNHKRGKPHEQPTRRQRRPAAPSGCCPGRDVDRIDCAMGTLVVTKGFRRAGPNGIFINPDTKEAWHDERSQRDHFWHPTLPALGFGNSVRIKRNSGMQRRRRWLEINAVYIAKQLGTRMHGG